ncbi:unnamed protein product [Caenorhabditis brenneri]
MSFPLHRLPFLALSEVLRSMDPFEHLHLSQTSLRYQSYIRNITKNYVYRLSGFFDERQISVGYQPNNLCTLNVQEVEDTENYEDTIQTGGTMCCTKTEKFECSCFGVINQLVMKYIDPKTILYSITCDNFMGPIIRYSRPNSKYNVVHRTVFDSTTKVYTHILSKCYNSEDLEAVLKLVEKKSINYYFIIKDSEWLKMEDLYKMIDARFLCIETSRTSITNVELKEFIMRWKIDKSSRLEHLKMKVEGATVEMLTDGLGAVMSKDGEPCFQHNTIRKRAIISIDETYFVMKVQYF